MGPHEHSGDVYVVGVVVQEPFNLFYEFGSRVELLEVLLSLVIEAEVFVGDVRATTYCAHNVLHLSQEEEVLTFAVLFREGVSDHGLETKLEGSVAEYAILHNRNYIAGLE